MDQTTSAPEVTTEDASGRLLALPNPEKCANRESAFSGQAVSRFLSSCSFQISGVI
jgi:hypothetical protein